MAEKIGKVTWSDFSVEHHLRPGIAIVDLKIPDLDDLVGVLKRDKLLKALPPDYLKNDAKWLYPRHRPTSKIFSGFRPKSFSGSIEAPVVTFTEPDLSFLRHDPKQFLPYNPDLAISFLVEAEMHSTGRGAIALIEALYTLYIKTRTIPAPEGDQYIALSGVLLNRGELNQAVSALKRNSSLEAYAARVQNFRVVRGGLPTLGERR